MRAVSRLFSTRFSPGVIATKTCRHECRHGTHECVRHIRKMIKAVKGMRDLLPPSTSVWNHVEAAAREVFRTYNYQEIRTPLLEETALFVRGVGEDTDV